MKTFLAVLGAFNVVILLLILSPVLGLGIAALSVPIVFTILFVWIFKKAVSKPKDKEVKK